MKKIWIGLVALTMALLVLCTACGGSSDKENSAAEPSPSGLPSVTAPPEGEMSEEDGMLKANANGSPVAGMDRATWLATLSEDQRKVEEELIGKTVQDLYKAIGKPKKTEYGTSCLVADGEDGILTYDGFTVSTTRFPNGQELVMGTTKLDD